MQYRRYSIPIKGQFMNKVLICNLGDDIMAYFPTNENEISLIKFIAKYQYLNVNNAKYFFDTSRYYRNRIKNLIDKGFLRKNKWSLVLGKVGIQYVKLFVEKD